MTILIIIIVVLVALFAIEKNRIRFVSKPAFEFFKRVLPPLSETERQAMEAGDVWWDGELFAGKPDWHTLHGYGPSQLSDKEQAFIDEHVTTVCAMLKDYDVVKNKDLPDEVWQYLKEQGFFALIIPESYGGREFSAYANSTIVAKISSCSLSAAVTVMVPNSLGPAELLMHYGTPEQQQEWLPALAKGEALPCFALTGVDAGSDAGSISDFGVVAERTFKGKKTVGISLSWKKRYITLAPVATVLGLAFKLYDPDGLLGDEKNLGICCALIPTKHRGVKVGARHNPMGMAFMNGTTQGDNVFIPLDWLIGGEKYIGQGWRMLVECLSAGRGISLPALASATAHLSCRATSAYTQIRQQFSLPIGKFEGIQQVNARIAGFTYMLEATRRLTTRALDLNQSPAVVTAIAKYHMTELSRVIINDAFDVHGGKAIQTGPNNYLAHAYMGMPISITVEGANILTRNLMIFGQGATRCHPYVLKEMQAAANPCHKTGLAEFDSLLVKHMVFGLRNAGFSFVMAMTGGLFAKSPISGKAGPYYKQLSRMSSALALCADYAMLTLGGELKRKEATSARLGDVLSHLYMASAVLKYYEDEGRQQSDIVLVQYALEYCLYQIGQAFDEFFSNIKGGLLLRLCIFPLGIHYKLPKDNLVSDVCNYVSSDDGLRERLAHLSIVTDDGPMADLESTLAFIKSNDELLQRFERYFKKAVFSVKLDRQLAIKEALNEGVITEQESVLLQDFEAKRLSVIDVDVFDKL